MSTFDHNNTKNEGSNKKITSLKKSLDIIRKMPELEEEESESIVSENFSQTSIIEQIPEEDEELHYMTADERSWRDVDTGKIYKSQKKKFILNYEEFEVSVSDDESENQNNESGSTVNQNVVRGAYSNFTQIHLFSANHVSSMTETKKVVGVPSFEFYDAAEGKKNFNFFNRKCEKSKEKIRRKKQNFGDFEGIYLG